LSCAIWPLSRDEKTAKVESSALIRKFRASFPPLPKRVRGGSNPAWCHSYNQSTLYRLALRPQRFSVAISKGFFQDQTFW